MNPSPTHFDPQADEQAALWAARLDGSVLSADDRKALDAWLAANPAHRTLLSNYCDFSAELEECLPVYVEVGAIKMPEVNAPRRFSPRLIWSSGLATAAVVALTLWFSQPATQIENLVTPAGQRQAITLADGTRVELNARTTLHVELAREVRKVRLTNGEAFFSVTKDPARPFIVETPSGSVRVTGTAFDVRTENTAKFVVTVVEGSVQVRPGEAHKDSDKPVLLGAGDRLSLNGDAISLQAMAPAALNDALAWRNGQIVFVDVPLNEAIAQFARYHSRNLTVAPGAAKLLVGGRFSLDDAEGFLGALPDILPVHVTRDTSGAAQVELRPAR